ncbi:hypothetical protein AMIS_20080 [Actinoplanes missouriensis 431]|uniref:Uncharacterized protein n=1 Tax=Actinoplanes missouriensis (strain ATCC 14538 / DSM 43046 / CBS 188.64 / JCM 3121 / NBRC 102363 / NCIMB 12654 / NRRL B-3342 / UNCC 431) TaxID=512565 RepID=I0H2J1_ACTM4|nr:hypothetical protein [Actinoplanes missouriensis]BAL87228.1 hypothetical protein AMIS_20080 [Actinoplanes missouriensis 431]
MSDSFAEEIRTYLDNVSPAETADETRAAVLAVVDKCEQLRAEPALRRDMNERFADEFEQTIARALGIEVDR